MNRAKDIENLLETFMSVEASDIERPSSALVNAARERVLARKPAQKELHLWERLSAFFRLDFKIYPIGLSLLLISGGIFYINEPSYTAGSTSGFMPDNEALSIRNTTISVNSSTMLTSIPTLVIRN